MRSKLLTGRLTLAAISVSALVAISVFLASYRYEAWDFVHNLWVPGRLLLAGQNPYSDATTTPILAQLELGPGVSVWMPTSLAPGLFLVLLPPDVASNVWLLASLVALFGSSGLVLASCWPRRAHTNQQRPSPGLLAAVLAVAIAFPPLYPHLLQGQVTLLMVALVLASAWLIDRRHPMVAGLLLSAATAKPQLLVAVVPILIIHAWRQGPDRLLGGAAVGLLAQTVPLWILYPGWPLAFVNALRGNPTWAQPSIHYILVLLTGSELLGVVAWIGTSAFALVWLSRRLGPNSTAVRATALALAVTPVLSPYVWSWDFVMMLPAVTLLFMELRRVRSYTAWIALYAVVVIAIVLVQTQISRDDMLRFPIPYAMLLLDSLARRLEKQVPLPSADVPHADMGPGSPS